MCMLQGEYNIKDLAVTLPQDVQALVLLHNPNANHNFTSTMNINNKCCPKLMFYFRF